MKRKLEFWWGQSTINTNRRKMSDQAIRKEIIQSVQWWSEITEVLSKIGNRNESRAMELYSNCPAIIEALTS